MHRYCMFIQAWCAGILSRNFLPTWGAAHRLYANCPTCKRTKVLDIDKLEQRFGPFFTLDEVRKRVRCSQCKQRTQTLRLLAERR